MTQIHIGECYETAPESYLKRHTSINIYEQTGLTNGTRLIITDITYMKGLHTDESRYGLSQSGIVFFQNVPILTPSITNMRFQNDDETILSGTPYTLKRCLGYFTLD
jgi:hypothetical protein